jgi:hypothetical protein
LHLIAPTRQAQPPRLDGHRVTFEIEENGAWLPCAISEAAILDVAGRKHMRPNELLGVFLKAQPQIEAIAQAKLVARQGYVRGILNIWSGDIEPPPDAAPAAAAAAMARA